MKKIIIFHISEFGGHTKAAQNIKEAINYRDPNARVLVLDGLKYFYPRASKIVNFIYTLVIEYFPILWGKIYDRKKIVKNLSPFRRFVNRLAFRKLSILVKNFNPDCFIVTQAFPCGIISDFKKKHELNVPLVAVVTDYFPHGFWVDKSINRYIVASEEAKNRLIEEGIDKDKISVWGIPISIKFNLQEKREVISQNLGFLKDLPSVLVMGGGWGIGPIRSIVKELDKIDKAFQIIVICGKNKRLYNWFVRNEKIFKKPIFYFGYIDFVNKIMDFVDIAITKAGGITISEALAKELAIIIFKPIPGQEERNLNYLFKKNAVLKANNIKDIKNFVEDLIKNKDKLNFLKQQTKKLILNDTSLKIADLVLQGHF